LSPDLHDLIGEDGTPEERRRLERVHDLLLASSPPPELPRSLEQAPQPGGRLVRFPGRRLELAFAVAASAVAVGFGIGYLVGNTGGFSSPYPSRAMHGVGALASASATIEVAAEEGDGNWPLRFTVTGLKRLPHGAWYTLYLTNHGKRMLSCGTFNTANGGKTVVQMNVPYDLREYDGWIVVESGPMADTTQTLLTT
jgi:hypothetical protein